MCPNIVCLAGYLGLVPILRKNKQYFPFLCYYLFPVRRICIQACHTSQGSYPGNIPPGSGRSTHGFGAQQDHEGPQDITQDIGNRAGNGAWVSCVLHPFTSLVLPGLGISHSLMMSTTRDYPLQLLIPPTTSTRCPPSRGVLRVTLVRLQRGSRGQARGSAADPGENRTSEGKCDLHHQSWEMAPRFNGGQNTLGLGSSYF